MADFKVAGLICMLGGLLVVGCENAEAKARYVKAPLENIDLNDRDSVNNSVNEARTRLASVRDDRLRADLSRAIDDAQAHARERWQEIERKEAAALEVAREAQAAREKAAAILEEERRRVIEQKYEAERKRAAEKRMEAPEKTVEETSMANVVDEQLEKRREAVERHRERAKEAVTELEVGIRDSALSDGTKVLVLRNAKSYPVSFDLRCFTRGNTAERTFSMRMPAGGERRIGFVQGWCGNFKGGERCEAYVDDELMWSYTVPEF